LLTDKPPQRGVAIAPSGNQPGMYIGLGTLLIIILILILLF
jgi:hypothetical protein